MKKQISFLHLILNNFNMRSVFLLLASFIFNFSSGYAQGSWAAIPNAPSNGRYDDMYFINGSVGFVSQDSEVF